MQPPALAAVVAKRQRLGQRQRQRQRQRKRQRQRCSRLLWLPSQQKGQDKDKDKDKDKDAAACFGCCCGKKAKTWAIKQSASPLLPALQCITQKGRKAADSRGFSRFSLGAQLAEEKSERFYFWKRLQRGIIFILKRVTWFADLNRITNFTTITEM